MIKTMILLFALLQFSSCSHLGSQSNPRSYMEAATLWLQNAAEYRALTYQAYNIASERLETSLKKRNIKNPAVVIDLDETVLNNSPYQAKGILDGVEFSPETWDEWVNLARAEAVPGAIDFLKKATSLGVEIFYVSNRKTSQIDVTYQNMVELGIPTKRENMLFRSTTSNKRKRREIVNDKHEVLLYIGDVLADFDDSFEDLNFNDRLMLTDRLADRFGQRYIVIPNPMYGDWERVLYGEESSPNTRSKIRKRYLYPY